LKKRVSLVLAACAVALAIPLSALAGGPNNKVTGDIWFNNPGFGSAHFAFSGQDVLNGTDKGTASYSDSLGGWVGTSSNVAVSSTTATMVVTVTSSTHPSVPVGSTHTFSFTDMGEAGINTGEPTSDNFTYGAGPTFYATAGNVQVHYRAS
jgi:hypothetical protein